MGLDMYLNKKELSDVAYWRKANAIHGWIVNNGTAITPDIVYNLDMDNLIELRDVCIKVTETHDEDIANELLPPTSGFFFGSDIITDYYWDYVAETATILSKTIDNSDEGSIFEYYASW